MTDDESKERLHFPPFLVLQIIISFILKRERNFLNDAWAAVQTNQDHIIYQGLHHIPENGPLFVILNHYTSPQVSVIWAALAISAHLPANPIWLMTSAWTKREPGWDALRTRLTRFLFARLAHIYGFITTPPMPPIPEETAERAISIRRLLQILRRNPQAILCFAPEGQDFPGGVLGQPPPGTGRLVRQITKTQKRILPVGVYQHDENLVVRFGQVFSLRIDQQDENDDKLVTDALMQSIAALLPAHLQGRFTPIEKEQTNEENLS